MKDAQALEATRDLASPPSRMRPVNLAADVDVVALLGRPATCVWVGTAGHVQVRYLNSQDIWTEHKNAPAGAYLVGTITHIRSTANGTTAADLLAGAP
jgi:hypothetical protein